MLKAPFPLETRAQAALRSPANGLDASRRLNYQAHWVSEPVVIPSGSGNWNGELHFDIDNSQLKYTPWWRGVVPFPHGFNLLSLRYSPVDIDIYSFFDSTIHTLPGPLWYFEAIWLTLYDHFWTKTEPNPEDPDPLGVYTYALRANDPASFDVISGMATVTIVSEGE